MAPFCLGSGWRLPPACEINAITEAALEACDDIDGIADGVITDSARCEFDPATIVGARSLRTKTKYIQIRYTRIDDLARFCKYLPMYLGVDRLAMPYRQVSDWLSARSYYITNQLILNTIYIS